MKPMPAKPRISMAQVEGSGTGVMTFGVMVRPPVPMPLYRQSHYP